MLAQWFRLHGIARRIYLVRSPVLTRERLFLPFKFSKRCPLHTTRHEIDRSEGRPPIQGPGCQTSIFYKLPVEIQIEIFKKCLKSNYPRHRIASTFPGFSSVELRYLDNQYKEIRRPSGIELVLLFPDFTLKHWTF